ncbi:MAG: hypothetical protein ACOCXJ_06820, partial [Planctomycetota bacterium]
MSDRYRVLAILLVLLPAFLAGLELPPGPADPERFPQRAPTAEPELLSWPPVVTSAHDWHVALSIPMSNPAYGPGHVLRLRWQGEPGVAATLPDDGRAAVGALALMPDLPGLQSLQVRCGDWNGSFPIHIQPVAAPDWPAMVWTDGAVHLADGGHPVSLLLAEEPDADTAARAWWSLPAATGDPLFAGDPLAVLGGDAWPDLPARRLRMDDHPRGERRWAAVLAELQPPLPALILWSPGDEALRAGIRDRSEELWLHAIRQRCQALGQRPRLLLLLPPLPVREDLQAPAARRRDHLRDSAIAAGWTVYDAAAVSGPPTGANRIAPGLLARHPVGAAQAAIAALLRRAIEDPDALLVHDVLVPQPFLAPGEAAWVVARQRGQPVGSMALVQLPGSEPLPLHREANDRSQRWIRIPPAEQPPELRLFGDGFDKRVGLSLRSTARHRPADLPSPGEPVLLYCDRPVGDLPPAPPLRPGAALLIGGDAHALRAQLPSLPAVERPIDLLRQDWGDAALLCWAPGAEPLVPHSEQRLIHALRWRRDHERPDTRLLLVLPTGDGQRRALLRSVAYAAGWLVLDPAAVGDPADLIRQLAAGGMPVQARLRLSDLPPVALHPGDQWQVGIRQGPGLIDGAVRLELAGGPTGLDLQEDGSAVRHCPIPVVPGVHSLPVRLPGADELRIRVADLRQGWPVAAIRDGQAVDAAGLPVVLLQPATGRREHRRWRLLTDGFLPSGNGPVRFWGDTPSWLRAVLARRDSQVQRLEPVGLEQGLLTALHDLATDPPRGVCWSLPD